MKTIIGSTILILLLSVSVLYPYLGPKDFNKTTFKYKNGEIVDRAPFPPSKENLLGTDRNGEDMALQLLYGAKFTLLATFSVSFLRVIFGGTFGIIMSLWFPWMKTYFKDFFLVFRYIPSVLLGIVLMLPVAGVFSDMKISNVILYQIIILVILGFPSVVLFASDLTDELKSKTFVQNSYLMGASHLFILIRHLMPYFRSYGLLFFVQQILSTLQILMHLGIFGIFFGGKAREGILGFDEPPIPATLSNEWAGLIGQNIWEFLHVPWVVLDTAFGFFFIIAIINMMKKEIEENITGTIDMKKINKKQKISPKAQSIVSRSSFEFVKKI
jgi:peptide/nickel transport system permease protein